MEKSVTSALAIVPPEALTAQIEVIRKEYDKAFERWPPHVNLLFPFVSESNFPDAIGLVEEALSQIAPFNITFAELGHFAHSSSLTLFARPDTDRPGALHELYSAVAKIFPYLLERDTFAGHLTLGQFKSLEALNEFTKGVQWNPISFKVEKIYFLARDDASNQRFVVRREVALKGTTFVPKGLVVNAEIHDLGALGRMIKVEVPSAERLIEAGVNVSKKKPLVVSIVDRSGSMGQWSARLVNSVLPNALRELGYPESERVVVITFDSVSERVRSPSDRTLDPTIKELASVSADCRGSTSMASAVKLLEDVLEEFRDQAISILVVSDGAIDDKSQTVAKAEAVAGVLKGRSAPISVALVQLLTSSSADPDTRAMSCIGSLNTAGKVSITEAHTSSSKTSLTPEESMANLVGTITTNLGKSTSSTVSLAAPKPVFHRLPGDTAAAYLTIPVGTTVTFLLKPDADPTLITCAGAPLNIKEMGVIKSEEAVMPFLEFAESQLRVWAVMGARKEEAQAIHDWFEKLQGMLTPVVFSTESLKAKDRAQVLLAKLESRKKSSIQRILQLGNIDRLSNLNSKQQADFLRGGVGATAVAVAKRASKVDADLDFDELCRNALKALAAKPPNPNPKSKPSLTDVSFYSRDTFSEIIEAARELAANSDVLTAIDALPLIGGVGVPFNAFPGNYPDPWSFQVIEVYPSVLLSENDLRTAVLQGADGGLQCPGLGRNAPITGVMPLALIDLDSYETYARGPLRPIAELQASVSIRGMLARVPYDVLARDAAVLVNLCQSVGPSATMPEFVSRIVTDVHATVAKACTSYAKGVFEDLTKDLATADPRPYLSGDRNISGTLKPYTAMLCVPEVKVLLQDPNHRAAILRSLYAYDAYITCRRGGSSVSASTVLGIDLEKSRIEVKPLFEPDVEPDWNSIVDKVYNVETSMKLVAEKCSWSPNPSNILAILRFSLGSAPLDPKIPEATYFGVSDIDFMKYAAVVLALSQPSESSRIDTSSRTALCPDLNDRDALIAHFRSFVKALYSSDYSVRVAAKRMEENKIRLAQLVASLIAADSLSKFLELLQGIPNRSTPGYVELEAGLLDLTKDVPERLSKLEVIFLARDSSGTPIWANGNVLMGKIIEKFFEVFKSLDPSGSRWEAALKIKAQYGIYHYGHNGRNRHGHGNDKPSYHALGYQTIDSMKKSISADEWDSYNKIHFNCCHNRIGYYFALGTKKNAIRK